jgi:hypothetical protein
MAAATFLPDGGDGRFDLQFGDCRTHDGVVILPAGAAGVWTLRFTVGGEPIRRGGGIVVQRERATSFGFLMQTDAPEQADYLQARTDADADLTVAIERFERPPRDWHPWLPNRAPGIRVTVAEGQLSDGDQVILTIGQEPEALRTPVVTLRSQLGDDEFTDFHVYCFVDPRGTGTFRKLPGAVRNVVRAATPARVIVSVDSVADAAGEFRGVVRVEDVYANLCVDFCGELKLRGEHVSDLPTVLQLTRDSEGHAAFTGRLTPERSPGSVVVDCPDAGICGRSNPILSRRDCATGIRWGELHVHTNMSWDGRGDLDEAYRFARDICKLDFAGITDHTLQVNADERVAPAVESWWRGSWWEAHQRAARTHAVPGRFVPLLAQEIHPGDRGDHNVYFPTYDAPLLMPQHTMSDPARSADLYRELFRELNSADCLMIPHVGGGPKKSWAHHDEQAEPLLEVASIHGCFESFAQGALQRGYRMGIVGGGDFHCGTPGSGGHVSSGGKMKLPGNRSCTYGSGFTAVVTDDMCVSGILAALRQRRCYAVTGQQRPVIAFSINTCPMGGELRCDTPPEICYRIISAVPVRSVAIVRNTEIAAEQTDVSHDGTPATFVDPQPRGGSNYYYLRITFASDDLAWTSPIWVDYSGAAPTSRRVERPWNAEEVSDLTAAPDNAATAYEGRVAAFLDRFTGERFHGLTGVRVVDNSYGRYALFFGFDRRHDDAHVTVRYFIDLPSDCVLIGRNWCLFDTAELNVI